MKSRFAHCLRWMGVSLFASSVFGVNALNAQESLWRDQNPYVSPTREGEILEIEVTETFSIDTDGQWDNAHRYQTKLVPDTKNIPFLTTSEQSKSNSKNNRNRYKLKDQYRFSVTGQLGKKQDNGNFEINAQRSTTLDGKPVRITLSGVIDSRRIKQGKIESKHIANLSMTITSEPPFPKDQKLNLQPPPGTDPKSKPGVTEFSESLRKELLIEHMKQILGGLNPP